MITQKQMELFWRKVSKEGSCWQWLGKIDNHGYGAVVYNGKTYGTHRLSYILCTGPVASGLVIDHICHNRSCVNPQHLRAVTPKQNAENRAGAQSNNYSSGIRGVTWHKKDKRWQASVRHNGHLYHCGRFANLEDAAQAVDTKRRELFTHSS